MKSMGDVVYGMEDGTVSIAGLVFGVAAGSGNSKAVLLAGAAGAISAAVSMMAGAYLDVASKRDVAQYKVSHERHEFKTEPQKEKRETAQMLRDAGFHEKAVGEIIRAMESDPGSMFKFQEAFELHVGLSAQMNPYAHAAWMFVADLIAAFTPVLPFAFFSFPTARLVAVALSALLLVILGVGRSLVSHRNIIITTGETLLIGVGAAAAGIVIGHFLGG